MSIVLHIMDAQGTLAPYKECITQTFAVAVVRITKVLPVDDVDVVLRDDPDVIPEIGMGGHAHGPYFVVLGLKSTHVDCKKVILEQLPGILAHELHHCLRWQKVGYGRNLLEAMITEGLAVHFERELTGVIQPWATALTDKEIKVWMKKARKEFSAKKYDHWSWFYGSKSKKIPRWTAYTLGYHLVGDYLEKHPKELASILYDKKAREFVE